MRNFYYSLPKDRYFPLFALMLGLLLVIQSVQAADIQPEIENQTFHIQENSPKGTVIGTIEAVNATSYSFVLAEGEELPFALDPATGVLTVSDSAMVDFEIHSLFEFWVQVRDNEGLSEQALITIEVEDVQKPVVLSSTATDTTENAALLKGTFQTGGAETTAAFQYGEELPLAEFDPVGAEGSKTVNADATESPVELQLNGLTDSVQYFYRLVARNSEGVTYGEVQDFRTFSIPIVKSISTRDQNPTNVEMVSFLVSFSEPVNGVDIEDFALDIMPDEGGELLATINAVSVLGDSGKEYVVTVNDISLEGNGTIKLLFVDKESSPVESLKGVNIGGEGPENGNFDGGEVYTIDNDPPSAYALLYTNEDVPVRYSFSVNSSPENPEDLIFSFESTNTALVGNSSYQLKKKSSSWEILIIPSPHMSGETDLTIYVKDAAGNKSDPPIRLKVVVRAVADEPLLVANSQEIAEDETLALGLSAELIDKDGSETLEQIVVSGVHPDAVLSAGTPDAAKTTYTFASAAELAGLSFTPPLNAAGVHEMILSATSREEAEGDLLTKKTATATKTFTITVKGENDAPAFALTPSSLEVAEDFTEAQYVAIEPAAVPADELEQTVTYSVAVKNEGEAPIATVVVENNAEGNPQLKITAIENLNGSQTFVVKADDGQAAFNEATQEFTLTVTAVNDAPAFALTPSSLEVAEDFTEAQYVAIEPAAVPADELEQTVTYSVAVKNEGEAPIATVVVENNAEGNPQLKITAIENLNGSQTFVVKADDGQAAFNEATQEFTLTVTAVNDAPAFSLSESEVIKEEDFAGPVTVTLTDKSPADEGEAITYSLEPASVAFAEVSINSSNGTITINPVADAHGSQAFTVVANDGAATYRQPFTLTVTAVNDAPEFTLSQTAVTKEEDFEGTVEVTLEDNSPDNEGEAITYSLSPASVDFVNISIDPETGKIEISAVADGNGSQTFVVKADDGQAAFNEATQEFTLTVTAVNDAPAFSLSESEVIKEEDFAGPVTVTLTDKSPADEGEAITYSLEPASVAFAEVSINSSNGTITINPVADAHGSQAFTVVANDGAATYRQPFTLTVTAVNDAPEFTLSQTAVTKEEDFEGTVEVTLEDNSPDNEGEAITYSLSPASVDFANVSFDAATGKISITSKPHYFGEQVFTLTANDGQNIVNETVTLTINPVNDAPVFTLNRELVSKEEDFSSAEKVTLTLEPAVYGEEGEVITYSLNPATVDFANMVIDAQAGVVTITSLPDRNGQQEIEVVATDNGQPTVASASQTFTLKVGAVPDGPGLAAELEDQTIYEDAAYTYTVPEAAFADPDGEILTYTATLVGGEALPEWLSFDAAARTFSGQPDSPEVGDYQIQVVAEDGNGQSVADDFVLTVLPVNDLPTISPLDDVVVELGSEVPAILFTLADEETPAAELTVNVVADNAALLPASAIEISGEGAERKLLLSPMLEQYGSSEISLTVSDGEGETIEHFVFTVDFRELALDIPTLITPNGDGANDTWNIRYLSLYETSAIRIFDRSGRRVFETENYLNGPEWDGTMGGTDLPEGVYFYEIILNGGKISKKGTLTISR
ncbi:tandem-95 repeat protein [Nafulsella turpanensis]|uniref:tandem-95 repeat protein n=2 Tax=Nafulsella turpanensis TaxID=1265690 RepID=UPI000348CDB7|nr:tandem-95 repeat protein [Nafulsella turpanensis]